MEPRKRRRIISRTISAAIALAAVTLIALGFVPKPVKVAAGTVVVRPLEITVDESGKTRIRSRYVVSAPVVGSLARITLKPGDSVEAGQVLAEISPTTPALLDQRTRSEAKARVSMTQANVARSQVTIKRAEASLSFAREQAERLRTLRKNQGASQQALDQAEFELRAAEEDFAAAQFGARVANHEREMAKATVQSLSPGASGGPALSVRSPISGQVLRVLQESEAVVQPGTQLLEIGDPNALEVVVDVLTTEAVKIDPGASARIERWGGDQILRARVRKKEPSAFTTRSALGVEEQRVPVVLDLTDPPARWAELGDGYRVETRIRASFIDQATVAPAAAVFRDGDAWALYAVRGDRAVKTQVELGARTPDFVEIKRGLSANTQVVLYPSDQIHDGALIAASEPPKSPAAPDQPVSER